MAYASITIATGATLDGRALAQNAAVTLDSNIITATVNRVDRPVALDPIADLNVAAGSSAWLRRGGSSNRSAATK
jgi:hypothetical protein